MIARFSAALSAADPDVGLAHLLDELARCGIVQSRPGQQPWLEVARDERNLTLSIGTEPARWLSEAQTAGPFRSILSALLESALARLNDKQQYQRVLERSRMLSSASFEGILVHEDGVVIDANQSLAELLGFEQDELLGPQTMQRCVAPEDMPNVLERMRERFEGAYVINGVRKDGSRFRAELQSKQGKLGERPVRVVAVRDVTERERTSALLKESESRLGDLAREAFDFMVFSRDDVIVEVTGSIERVLGFEPAELVGHPLIDFVAPSAMPLATQILANQRTGPFELLALSKSGEHVPVSIVAALGSLDGQPVRVGAVRDLREAQRRDVERRRLEEQLQRSQRLESLGVLAGGVAHDFNNLLVGVLGNAELLLDVTPQPEDRQLCEAIIAAAQRAADLTSQLLAYAGQRDLGRRQPVDLSTLWRELGTLLGARLSKNARVELRLAAGSVVLGDRATLTQMLMNLLTNASDALEDRPGTIEVTTTRVREPDARWDHALGAPVGPGNWVCVEVRDTGIGMNPATLLRVFEPFFSTKDRGHGLGLASCLGIVSSHGGALLVESESGRGSHFSVLLPAAERAVSEPPVPLQRARERPCRILVVDDEAVVRSLLRRSLERRGYTVTEAPDGHTALRSIAEAEPDLMLLDMTMPDLDGAEVLRRVRAQGIELPVVIASGHLDSAAESRLARGSFQGFLRKPFSVTELVNMLESALSAAPASAAVQAPARR